MYGKLLGTYFSLCEYFLKARGFLEKGAGEVRVGRGTRKKLGAAMRATDPRG